MVSTAAFGATFSFRGAVNFSPLPRQAKKPPETRGPNRKWEKNILAETGAAWLNPGAASPPILNRNSVMKKTLPFAIAALTFSCPAAIIQFDLIGSGGPGMLFTSEPGVLSGGSGGEILGGISFDDVTKLLAINVGWGSANGFTNLTGNSTNAHLHGPTINANGNDGSADWMQTAGTMINLQGGIAPGFVNNSSLSAGTITGTGTTPLTPAQESALMTGRTYINIHTVANPGGEIRGFLVPIPEPAGAAFAFAAAGVLALRRRR
jgi:hypothetical protein